MIRCGAAAWQAAILRHAGPNPDAASCLFVAAFNLGISGGGLIGGLLAHPVRSGPTPPARRYAETAPELTRLKQPDSTGRASAVHRDHYGCAAGGQVDHPGKLVSQRQLLAQVWGLGYRDETNYLRIYLARLRRNLEQVGLGEGAERRGDLGEHGRAAPGR